MTAPANDARKAEDQDLRERSNNRPVQKAVSYTHLDVYKRQLPWGVRTEDNFDLDNAQRTLDDEHFGLDKVKERIMRCV